MSFIFFIQLCFLPQKRKAEALVVEGLTMGTTYRVIYFDEPSRRNFKFSLDSLLVLVNKSISPYDSTSEISQFNKSIKGISFQSPFLQATLKKAREIYVASHGAFDPTVMPLVNAWGFGPKKSYHLTAQKVDSLKQFVGFDKIKFSATEIAKPDPRIQIDMGGIGQGFGADVMFQFLKSKGIEDLLVELGGEGLAFGKNLNKDQPWKIGILDPNSTPEYQFFKAYVTLCNKAFTTSGNYFNYRIFDGQKFGHTIDPVSGYPVQHELLSVSLFAEDCTTADGWATAFMVMGLQKSIARLKQMPELDALLLYSTSEGEVKAHITPRLKKFITLEK